MKIEGKKVGGIGDILAHIGLNESPGDEISLKVPRDGEIVGVTVELGTRPPIGANP